MAEKKNHKTPEELEQAVGQKIDELFGDLFNEEAPEEPEQPAHAPKAAQQRVAPATAPSTPTPKAVPPPAKSKPPLAPAPPVGKAAPQPRPSRPATPAPGAGARQRTADSFDNAAEQMEILILNLEWEVSPESVNGLIRKFKELERFFPSEAQARTILAMNRRGLQRFSSPDAVPHPSLVKLLQDSLAALRLIHSSQGKRPPSDTLIAGLTASYREIMASAPVAEAASVEGAGASRDERRPYPTVISDVGTAIHSLEEVSQRLARILGVLRQGGEMSTEEITRRLGTLEHLLSERVGQLLSFHKELATVSPPVGNGQQGAGAPARSGNALPNGLLMVVWEGLNLAIPSSALLALYPISKTQAEQFAGKTAITLGSRQIPRLPLKAPTQSVPSQKQLPTWLLHLSSGKKDYFLLANRSLGFRMTPKGVDVSKPGRIKIGATSYILLNVANFH